MFSKPASTPSNAADDAGHEAPQDLLLSFFVPMLSAGGAERVVLALTEQFAAWGIRCDLVTAAPDGAWADRIPNGVRHITLGHKKPLHAIPRLVGYLRRERPTVLLSSVFPANIAALLACTLTHTPCVIREANRSADDTRSEKALQTWINRAALRMLYPYADGIVALSTGLAAHLCELVPIMPAKITVIPNPVPAFAPISRDMAADADSVPLVLACGRLEPQKDFATLLEAFAMVRALRTARLAILGTGSQEGALRAHAEGLGVDADVDFIGYTEDVDAWMRRARVFALSSRWEGFPNVLLEALSQRCPVVATDCSDAVPELLAGGKLGTIVPVGDASALATALLAVIDGSQRFDDPGEHLKYYAIDQIAQRYLNVMSVAAGREI